MPVLWGGEQRVFGWWREGDGAAGGADVLGKSAGGHGAGGCARRWGDGSIPGDGVCAAVWGDDGPYFIVQTTLACLVHVRIAQIGSLPPLLRSFMR